MTNYHLFLLVFGTVCAVTFGLFAYFWFGGWDRNQIRRRNEKRGGFLQLRAYVSPQAARNRRAPKDAA